MGRNYFFYIATFLTLAIAIGSLIPLKNGLGIGMHISDKILHTTGYCFLTLSWLLACKPQIKHWKAIILVVFLIFIYGIIIEILQGALTSNRQADIYDVFANLTGITIATLFFAFVLKKNVT